jgi:teichuronic acid biosynthesis glycosyltransferase TuaG
MKSYQNKQPLVSVIMPAFNAGHYIYGAIQSVLNQSYADLELIIVNDGSNDNTEAEILRFDDPRILYSRQFNAGVSSARNAGLSKMTGDFFCFLDADDIFPVDSLSERLKCFTEREVCFVDGAVEVFDPTMEKIVRSWAPKNTGYMFHHLVRLDTRCFFW